MPARRLSSSVRILGARLRSESGMPKRACIMRKIMKKVDMFAINSATCVSSALAEVPAAVISAETTGSPSNVHKK